MTRLASIHMVQARIVVFVARIRIAIPTPTASVQYIWGELQNFVAGL